MNPVNNFCIQILRGIKIEKFNKIYKSFNNLIIL